MKGKIVDKHDRTIIALCFIITWFLIAVMMGGIVKLERLITEEHPHVAE